jgi:hypothetical protein
MANTTEESKVKRPSFSPPKGEAIPEVEVLTNKGEDEVVKNHTEPEPTPPSKKLEAPTPPAKFITKGGPDKEASFDKVLGPEDLPIAKPDSPDDQKPVSSKSDPDTEKKSDTIEEIDLDEVDMSPNTNPGTNDSNGPSLAGRIVKLGFILLLIAFGASGWYLYLTSSPEGGLTLPGQTQPTPSPEPTEAPPTPTPVDRSAITIEVLNGAGISGAAGTTADTLAAMGYTIADTGNAANSNYTETEIYLSSDFPEEMQAFFLDELEDEFGPATLTGDLEGEDLEYNTRIVLGRNWFETEGEVEGTTDETEAEEPEPSPTEALDEEPTE